MLQVFIGFLLIIFILIVVPIIPKSDLYGRWIDKDGRCTANDIINNPGKDVIVSCKNGGTKYITTYCQPNSITSWGCRNITSTNQLKTGKTGSSQSFDTFIRKESCDIKCIKQTWKKISESDCINITKVVSYMCVKNDPEGSDNCYAEGENGRIYYPLGAIYKKVESCVSSTIKNEETGKWILLDPDTPDFIIGNSTTSEFTNKYNNYWEPQKYLLTPKCKSEGSLILGQIEGKIGCLFEGKVYTQEKALEFCKYSPPNLSTLINCFNINYNNSFGIISTKNNQYIILTKYPDRVRNTYQTNIPLVFSKIGSNNECSVQESIKATAVRFYFVPVQNNLYKIALVATNGLIGWMETQNNFLLWTQLKLGQGLPGKELKESESFLVNFDNNKISIRGEKGEILYIKSSKGKIILINLYFHPMNFNVEEFNNECLPSINPYDLSHSFYYS